MTALATINEEHESEISSITISREETDNDDKTDYFHKDLGDDSQNNTISIQSKTFSIDSDASSYMCFKKVAKFSSSMVGFPLYFFPELDDPGIEDAFTFSGTTDLQVEECQKYKNMCKDMDITPISRVCKSLNEKKLDLKYYVPDEKQMKAICKTLENNDHITELILQDNWLSPESCGYLASVLETNRTLNILNLKECRIGPEGMTALADSLSASSIEELDLSFNSLGPEGIKEAVNSLGAIPNLIYLNLSHNGLTEEAAPYLGIILSEASILKKLDLSWNNFNTPKGIGELCKGLVKNQTISWLSLAWNGISTIGPVIPLAKYLNRSNTLRFLDLSYNLLKGPSLKYLMKGIASSRSIQHLKIGNNMFSPQEAFRCASILAKPRRQPLELLDMENAVVQKNFLNLLNDIRNQGKDVKHGVVLGDYVINGPWLPKILFGRCKYLCMKPKKKKNRVDFGQFVLSLPDTSIPIEDFQALLSAKKLKLRLNPDLITALQTQYLTKKSNEIDCSQLMSDYMVLYPDTQLLPPKKKKQIKSKNKTVNKKKQKKKQKKDAANDTSNLPGLNIENKTLSRSLKFDDNNLNLKPITPEQEVHAVRDSSVLTSGYSRHAMKTEDLVTENSKENSYINSLNANQVVEQLLEDVRNNALGASPVFILESDVEDDIQ